MSDTIITKISEAKQGLDDVKAIADGIQNLKGVEEGATKLLKAMKIASKFSAVFGVIGAGLDVANIFIGGDSGTVQILKAIQRLSAQLQHMENKILVAIDDLENQIEQKLKLIVIEQKAVSIQTFMQHTNIYYQDLINKNTPNPIICKSLAQVNPMQIVECFNQIKAFAIHDHNGQDDSFLKLLYDSPKNPGDYNKILKNALYILTQANNCITAYACVNYIQKREENIRRGKNPGDHNMVSQEDCQNIVNAIHELFDPGIIALHEYIQGRLQDCIDNAQDNIASYMNNKLQNDLNNNSNSGDHLSGLYDWANKVTNAIAEKYFWMDYTVFAMKHDIHGDTYSKNRFWKGNGPCVVVKFKRYNILYVIFGLPKHSITDYHFGDYAINVPTTDKDPNNGEYGMGPDYYLGSGAENHHNKDHWDGKDQWDDPGNGSEEGGDINVVAKYMNHPFPPSVCVLYWKRHKHSNHQMYGGVFTWSWTSSLHDRITYIKPYGENEAIWWNPDEDVPEYVIFS